MDDYILLTDSSADLPAELVEELDVEVLPLSFTINGTDRVGAYGNKYNVTVMLSADTTEPSEAETGE